MRTYCIAQGTLLSALWWPKWERNPIKRGHMYTHSWFTLLYSRNTQHCKAIIFQLRKFFKSLIKLQYHLRVEASYCSTLPHWARCSCFLSAKPGVSNLQNLMSDDPSWSWCNNNRDKVHNTFNAFELSPNHPSNPLCPWSVEKLSSTKHTYKYTSIKG